jgi:hypothetical protein
MSSKQVLFQYLQRVVLLLGIEPARINNSQKVCALLMFILIYLVNTVISLVATLQNSKARLGVVIFLPISIIKMIELLYFVGKSRKIREIMDEWKVIERSSGDARYFAEGMKFTLRINKLLLSQLVPKLFIGPVTYLITKKSAIQVDVPVDNCFGFLVLWLYQTSYFIYGGITSYVLDLAVFYNFSMMESYSRVVSDLMKESSVEKGSEIYLKFLRQYLFLLSSSNLPKFQSLSQKTQRILQSLFSHRSNAWLLHDPRLHRVSLHNRQRSELKHHKTSIFCTKNVRISERTARRSHWIHHVLLNNGAEVLYSLLSR